MKLPFKRAGLFVRRNIHNILNGAMFIIVLVLLGMFIKVSTIVAANSHDTKEIVQSQNDILRQLNLDDPNSNLSKLKNDNHIDHDTLIKYVKCVVELSYTIPDDQKVTQVDLDNCLIGTRLQVTSASGGSSAGTSSSSVNNNSLPQSAPTPTNTQRNNLQRQNFVQRANGSIMRLYNRIRRLF